MQLAWSRGPPSRRARHVHHVCRRLSFYRRAQHEQNKNPELLLSEMINFSSFVVIYLLYRTPWTHVGFFFSSFLPAGPNCSTASSGLELCCNHLAPVGTAKASSLKINILNEYQKALTSKMWEFRKKFLSVVGLCLIAHCCLRAFHHCVQTQGCPPWTSCCGCQTHANAATCGQVHQAGDNGHLCHRKTLSSPLAYNKPTPMAYLSNHNSWSFSEWFLLRDDTITFTVALGEQLGRFRRSNPRFLFPLSLPLALHHLLPNPSILNWPGCP